MSYKNENIVLPQLIENLRILKVETLNRDTVTVILPSCSFPDWSLGMQQAEGQTGYSQG